MVAIGRIVVEGEVHRPSRRANGRLFFTLRDRAAQLSVTVPPARLGRSRAVTGERVQVSGTLSWFNDWGQLLLVADEVVPVGEGAVAAAIAEARRRLAADGLLDRARRPLPRLPERIGVICGTDAAVRADIESVVAVRFPGYPIDFVEVVVQGPGAVDAVIDAMARLDRRPEVQVIILARGGGDAVSLLPFSDEALCRAVAASGTAVVAAIGHEGDRPLGDDVADLRCGTPSLAAAAVVPDRAQLLAALDRLAAMAGAALTEHLLGARRRLAAAEAGASLRSGLRVAEDRLALQSSRLELLHPSQACRSAGRRLAALDWRGPVRWRLDRAAGRLTAQGANLEALSPARVLERGYAVVRLARDGSVVRSAAGVAPGEKLDIQVAAGRLQARTEERPSGEVDGGR
jgi:exodeoxyribonuclease VII large subunit